MLAKAFANECDYYFMQSSPADIQSVWIGQTQKNIKDIFTRAKERKQTILFIDELDSLAFSRDELHAHTDQKATINQLLIEMNNISDYEVIVIGATNMLDKIDNAPRRSGRFDQDEIKRRIDTFSKTLNKEMVRVFIEQCEADGMRNQKIEFLKNEWEIDL